MSEEKGRRRKIVPVSPELLHALFTEGNEIHAKCVHGIPEDAHFIGIACDPRRDLYYLCFESQEWEPVSMGEQLPELIVVYKSLNGVPNEIPH